MKSTFDPSSPDPLWAALSAAGNAGNLGACIVLVGGAEPRRAQVAELLTRLLLCSEPTARPCETCACCRARALHPDSFILERADGDHSISLEQTLSLSRFALLGSAFAGMRVARIPEAHLLTTASANALLKLLEEPPANFTCILGTPNARLLLPTIRSRAQMYRIAHTDLVPDSTPSEPNADMSDMIRDAEISAWRQMRSAVTTAPDSRAKSLERFRRTTSALTAASRLARASVASRLLSEWLILTK